MGRLLAILTLCAAIPAVAQQAPFSLTFGAVECEFTRCGLDTVRWRDRPVLGDLAEDPRPAAQFVLLKQGWSQLAAPSLDGANEPRVQPNEDAVTVELSGVMAESGGGPGRWEWSQTWQVKRSGLLSVDYSIRQLAAPQEGWWLHRLALIGNRDELFVEPPNQDLNTPGKPIPIETRDGSRVAPPFGGKDSIVRDPAHVHLPFAGHEVLITCDPQARSVELWNGWWRQNVNFELPIKEQVSAHFEFDISQLPQTPQPAFVLSPIVREPEPWADAEIPPFPPVQRPLRFAQNAPTIIAWGDVRGHEEQELERFYTEMQKHFDILELMVGWTDWKWDLDWSKDEGARRHAEAIAAEVQKQVRIAHKHGIRLALSLNFGGSGPGTGGIETRRQPQYQAETLDPETGTFSRAPEAYDWCSPAAVDRAYRAYLDCAKLCGPVDYLFFNEPHWRMSPWHGVPLFSEAALADFRQFSNDPQARFPAKPYVPDTPRTDNQAQPDDWARWYDWAQDRFARSIATQAKAFAEANRDNPDYGGAIYFQHVGWTGPQYAVDLDRIAAIPEITWLCAEYVTDASSPRWRKFKYYAQRHGKRLSSFVNIGWYDPKAPGRVRYEGTDEGFARAVRMGIDENAPMVTLFPADALNPASEGYHEARTRIWDEATGR